MKLSLGAAAASFAPAGAIAVAASPAAKPDPDTLGLNNRFPNPIKVQAIQLLRFRGRHYVRATSADGAVGVVAANGRIRHIRSLFEHLAVPFFRGRDARDLESLVDGVYTHGSNYKYAGMPFWNAVAHCELSLWDMLGRIAGKPVGGLLGKVIRHEIPVYISGRGRSTTPEQEVKQVAEIMQRTGTPAVKFKIGGRMKNRPQDAERTNRLIPLARKTLGDKAVIYADANGSYTAGEAIRVGGMLADQGVAFFEEPCPWQDYEQTKRVTEALEMTVAGGEQDTSLPQFRWMIRNRVVDVVQPDVFYNGGLVRILRVARMAATAGMTITPHSPQSGVDAFPLLHFASVAANLGPHAEYTPGKEIEDGKVKVPAAPGLGIEYDAGTWERAEVVR